MFFDIMHPEPMALRVWIDSARARNALDPLHDQSIRKRRRSHLAPMVEGTARDDVVDRGVRQFVRRDVTMQHGGRAGRRYATVHGRMCAANRRARRLVAAIRKQAGI